MARIADADGNLTGVVVMGQATSNLWFDLVDGQFVARFSATETLVYYPDELVYRLTDLSGNVTEFGSFDIIASGMFLSRTDPAGNVTQVVSLADNGGNAAEVQRSDGSLNIESYLYDYGSPGGDGILRLASVLLRRSTNGGLGWTNVRQAIYDYWNDGDVGGSLGDLRTVTVQAWNGLGWGNMGTTLYRYYQSPPYQGGSSSSSVASSSSGSAPEKLDHLLNYVVNADSYARLAADPNAGGDPASAPDWVVAQYADNYFEFDSERRVTLESVEGGSRTYLFSYAASGFAPDYNAWATKTTETLPGGTQNITYANFAGQVMLSVKVPAAGQGAGPWYAYYRYNDDGQVVVKAESSAVTGYDEAYADLLNCQPAASSSSSSLSGVCNCPPICSGNLEYLADHTGLIHLYDYDAASGQVTAERIRGGEFGCDNKLWERSYEAFVQQPSSSSSSSSSAGAAPAPLTVYQLSQSIVYPDDITVDPSQSRQIVTSYAYTFFPDTAQVQRRTTTWPVVSTSQNGSGIADSRVDFFDTYGNATWSKDERGFIQYRAYDVTSGGLVQSIEDVDSSQTVPPDNWTTPAGGGLHLITDYTIDFLGRTVQALGPAHVVDIDSVATAVRTASWTAYLDDQFTVYSGQGYQTGMSSEFSYTLVNPVSITVSDAAGKVTDQISAVRASTAGALSASDTFPQSSYCRWTSNQYADGTDLSSTRVYYSIPASGVGVEGVNYNQTRFGYDLLDRRNRLVSPGGTITRTLFDARNQPTAVWVGTNDTGATDTDPTGGGTLGNNMALITEYQYDGGLAGLDCNRTSETQHVDASTTRVTAFAFDWRDRAIQVTAAQNTYQVTTLDNLRRATQVDRHAQSDGTLIGRSQTSYDDVGRVYQTITVGVDPRTGEVGAGLTDNNWYDPSCHTIKELPSGSNAFTKSVFDGAGRQTTIYYGYDLGSGESSYSSTSPVLGRKGPRWCYPTDDLNSARWVWSVTMIFMLRIPCSSCETTQARRKGSFRLRLSDPAKSPPHNWRVSTERHLWGKTRSGLRICDTTNFAAR